MKIAACSILGVTLLASGCASAGRVGPRESQLRNIQTAAAYRAVAASFATSTLAPARSRGAGVGPETKEFLPRAVAFNFTGTSSAEQGRPQAQRTSPAPADESLLPRHIPYGIIAEPRFSPLPESLRKPDGLH